MTGIPSLFRAQVIDTQQFKSTGKIHVHVFGYTVENTFTEAEVLTSFGGLPGMGIQSIPPIGAIGFVLFERTQRDLCVWVGGVLAAVGNQFEIFKDAVDDGYGNPIEAANPEDFVIKTQHTTFEDRDLDGKNNRVENIIKMNKEELTLAKVNQSDDNYEYKKASYDMDPNTNPDLPYQILQIKDDGIVIKYKPTNSSSNNYMMLTLNESGLEMKHKAGNEERTLSINEDGVSIDAKGQSVITVKNDGTVVIEATRIELGGNSSSGVLYEQLRDFINNTYQQHVHGSSAGPTSIPTTSSNTSAIKSKKVKLD
jgi:hypothetical protein